MEENFALQEIFEQCDIQLGIRWPAIYKWEALAMDVLCHPSRQQVKYVHIINIADCHQIEVQP